MFLTSGSYPKESHRDATEIRAEAEQRGGWGGDMWLRAHVLCEAGSSLEDTVGGGTLPLPFRGFLRGSPATEAGDTPKASPEGQCPGQPKWGFCSISK